MLAEIKGGNTSMVLRGMVRGLRREIAATEAGEHPFKSAYVKVPKVKMTGHFRRPPPEDDDPAELVDPVERESAPAAPARQADIKAEIDRRVRLRLAEERAKDKATKGKGKAKRRARTIRERMRRASED